MDAPALVEARGWGWRHAGRREPAVVDLEVRIGPGERVLVLGASGSGKSTLLAALAGVLGDEEGAATGELLVDGLPPAASRGRTGLVLQDPDAQVVLARVGDDVAFGCENLGVPREEIWRRVPAALEDVGLRVPLEHPTGRLSGGQKQRLALAGVLAMRPGLVLLDEPTANLDPAGVAEVRDAVARSVVASSATLLVVEHHVAVWADLVDRVLVLERGRLVADGPPDRVLADPSGSLAAAGVWLPGRRPPVPPRAPRAAETGSALATDEPLLAADGLAVGRGRSVVRRDLEVRVEAGRMLGLTGVNGSGKTTLALTLGGLLPPLGGLVRSAPALAARGRREPIRWRSRELLTRLGTVFQEPDHQFLTGSVRAELEVGPRALGLRGAALAERVDPLLERLRLTALATANPFTLSGGEKRRLSVATVLATAPAILVLDEPTFGQDARTWAELVALLAALLDDGRSIVAASHDAAFLAVLADATLELTP